MKRFLLVMVAAAAMCTQGFAQQTARVKTLSTSTNVLNVSALQDAEQTVQLSRYLFAGYNTLCLPMSLSSEQLAKVSNGLKVERLAAMAQDGDELMLYFVDCTADGIEAGVPYLVYSPTSQFIRVKNTDAMSVRDDLRRVRMSDGQGNTVVFGSSWESVQKEGLYGIPAKQDVYPLDSKLIRTEADKTFLPTRCGFVWEQQSATASRLVIRHAMSLGEVAGIGSAVSGAATDGNVYDMQGRKVVSPREGLYVKQGRKVIVK